MKKQTSLQKKTLEISNKRNLIQRIYILTNRNEKESPN